MREGFIDFLAKRIEEVMDKQQIHHSEDIIDEVELSETASNKFEVEVTEGIRRFLDKQTDEKYRNLSVEHYEGTDLKYWSDIKITNPVNDKNIWVEAKLNKYANLGSASFKYQDEEWSCTTLDDNDPLYPIYMNILKEQGEEFIGFCKDYLRKDDIKLPTDLTEDLIEAWKHSGNISDTENDVQFITDKVVIENFGEKVSEYYKTAKNEPVYYIQVGDNLYIIDKEYNVLNLKTRDGKELRTFAEAHKIGRIQFRAKGLAKEQKYYYSIYSDVKILADKDNDSGDYTCSFLEDDKFPVVESKKELTEGKFEFHLKDKEHTWKPEQNKYAFKNKSETYGGDDYIKSTDIIDRIDPNLHSKFGPRNWFHGPDCLDSKTSKIHIKLDDGKDSIYNIEDVIRSKTQRGIIYLVPTKGNGMSLIDVSSKLTHESEFLGTLKPYNVVVMNPEDESVYVCNGMKVIGNDIELEFEWGDIIDYSEELKENESENQIRVGLIIKEGGKDNMFLTNILNGSKKVETRKVKQWLKIEKKLRGEDNRPIIGQYIALMSDKKTVNAIAEIVDIIEYKDKEDFSNQRYGDNAHLVNPDDPKYGWVEPKTGIKIEVVEVYDPPKTIHYDNPYDNQYDVLNGYLSDKTKLNNEAEKDIGGKVSDTIPEEGIKIWIDDLREAPEGFKWFKTVNSFIDWCYERQDFSDVSLIDTDHDAGDYRKDGGDYIRIFDYLDSCGVKNLTIHIHSANPVGANNIRRIISRNKENGWKEIKNSGK